MPFWTILFWTLAALLALLVAALLIRPLRARRPAGEVSATDQAIYRGQLAEVERDVARGVLAPEEADRARTEIARRLLAADRAGAPRLSEAPARAATLAAAMAGIAVLGGVALYAALGQPGLPDLPRAERLAQAEALREARPSQAEAEASAREAFPVPAPDLPPEELALIEELRRVVPTRPDDLRGWELLARHEARLGRYAEAARAQERVIALKGEAATAQDLLDLADRMVAAAGGVVTPETEGVLAALMERDPVDHGLLYYLGLLEAQTGRPDRAFPLWRKVVDEAPDGLHRRLALSQIEEAAWLAGVDYTPPAPPAAAAPASGPTADQMADAQDMDPEARAAMIRGMVQGLSDRLTAEGGTPEEWAQLVNALAVIGDRDAALAALARAREAHGTDEGALSILAAVAAQAGLEPAP